MTQKDCVLIADTMIEVYRKAKYSGRITETAGQLFIDLGEVLARRLKAANHNFKAATFHNYILTNCKKDMRQ